jgi:hypothetical protein
MRKLIAAILVAATALAAADAAVDRQSIVNSPSSVVSGADAVTIPQMLSYQGKMTDTFGLPVADTLYAIRFRLYAQPTGGTQFWEENQNVRTTGGLFSVLLGSVTPIGSMPDAGAAYLGMSVADGAELTPRLRIASAAYAYLSARAANSDQLQGRDTTTFSRNTHNHDATYVNEAQADAVTSAMIVNGTVAAADLNQMGAASGQVMKWTGSAWAPRNDSVGGGGSVPDSVPGSFAVTTDLRVYGKGRIGLGNSNAGTAAFAAGEGNTASANYSSVSGGADNSASGVYSHIGGGGENRAAGDYSAVGGGVVNYAAGGRSAVVGGSDNEAYGLFAAIGGGRANTAGDAAGDTCATVAGGRGNLATGMFAFVGGGKNDTASGASSTVAGGEGNRASGSEATVGGGLFNQASASVATVCGGWNNNAAAGLAVVCGGFGNVASGEYAFVGGGTNDTATGRYSGVLSGRNNKAGDAATDTCAVVAGGYGNRATGRFATVGGGQNDSASGDWSTVGGGNKNAASMSYATVGGGYSNNATGHASTVGGGSGNDADTNYATVSGGGSNLASGYYATIGGGFQNHASGSRATVGGGGDNYATNSYATASGGTGNHASGWASTVSGGNANDADAPGATVGGGEQNAALGEASTVAGGGLDTSAAFYSFTTNWNSVVPSGFNHSAAFNGQRATASSQTRVGALSKASGTFTIDHPLDPNGRILNHYFIEGPEMLNIYRGSAVLDGSGRAVVALPDYFDALNRTPMIQLTGVGTREVIYVAEDVSGNRFAIGGPAGAKVYWQVTGERQDVSAEITRRLMPVEQPKTGVLAGTMLDDDFLRGAMDQLVREGKAQGIDFRTAAGRQRYEKMKQMTDRK